MAPRFVNEVYPPHLVARKHNNRGAQLIEAMNFDHAINELRKALGVAERLATAESLSTGSCVCSLDLFVASSFVNRHDQNQPCIRRNGRSDDYKESNSVGLLSGNLMASQDEESSCGYLFRKPVYVSAESLQDGQHMGPTLSLIAIFNLGLAYQLAALQPQHQQHSHDTAFSLQGTALRLYEVAYQLHTEQQRQQEERAEEGIASRTAAHQLGSLRFMMIIANNMSEIYRLRNDTSRHEICLENMLSVMMYMIDCEIPAVDCIEMDGLLRNASHVILRKHCAKAA